MCALMSLRAPALAWEACDNVHCQGLMYALASLGLPLLRGRRFFCSNASIALARSLCKCLLAVLITASEAEAVTASKTRGVKSYDVIPHEKRGKHQNKQEKHQPNKNSRTSKNTNQNKPKNPHNQAVE